MEKSDAGIHVCEYMIIEYNYIIQLLGKCSHDAYSTCPLEAHDCITRTMHALEEYMQNTYDACSLEFSHSCIKCAIHMASGNAYIHMYSQ